MYENNRKGMGLLGWGLVIAVAIVFGGLILHLVGWLVGAIFGVVFAVARVAAIVMICVGLALLFRHRRAQRVG